MIWETETESPAWDANLALLGGHPLQSALWGEGRRRVDGIRDHRWQLRKGGELVWMARIEERRLPGVGRVAWIPKGPTTVPAADFAMVEAAVLERLRDAGFIMAVTDRWRGLATAKPAGGGVQPRTIWLDLSRGSEELWRELDSQWRYGVGRARREGVLCELTTDAQDIVRFFSLCSDISRAKGFQLPGSAELIQHLLQGSHSEAVSAHLMVARARGGLAAGACVLRCGNSAHYFWGASDRGLSRFRGGEAVQWAVIEWALDQGCSLYDLEGIDPVRNPGVYEFKKKMGGVDVTLEGMIYRPLGWRGVLLDGARRLLNR